jgi:NhaP-type Na+/H+ or K+/H+ antiporter
MNPALLVTLMLVGTGILLGAVFAAVVGALPWSAAAGLGAIGAAVETAATIAFIRSRRKERRP